MSTSLHALRRRQLDDVLRELSSARTIELPREGWIKTVRKALGMTASQLGKRLEISQPSVTAMEQGEVLGSITLNTLRKAANALECDVVYAIVPRESLENVVEKRVRQVITERVKRTAHTMDLEKQSVRDSHLQEQIDDMVRDAMKQLPPRLWG